MQRRHLFRRVFRHVHRRAGADEIAVTKGTIDAANGWPVFIGAGHRMVRQPDAGYRHVASHQP